MKKFLLGFISGVGVGVGIAAVAKCVQDFLDDGGINSFLNEHNCSCDDETDDDDFFEDEDFFEDDVADCSESNLDKKIVVDEDKSNDFTFGKTD